MQNPINLQVSEVVDTYVYRVGLASPYRNSPMPPPSGSSSR